MFRLIQPQDNDVQEEQDESGIDAGQDIIEHDSETGWQPGFGGHHRPGFANVKKSEEHKSGPQMPDPGLLGEEGEDHKLTHTFVNNHRSRILQSQNLLSRSSRPRAEKKQSSEERNAPK